jgi:hypothetical protein
MIIFLLIGETSIAWKCIAAALRTAVWETAAHSFCLFNDAVNVSVSVMGLLMDNELERIL